MRRMATVTKAGCAAASASSSTCWLGYPPEPINRREAKLLPAIVSTSEGLLVVAVSISTATEGFDDLDGVAGRERDLGPASRRHHRAVDRDGDAARLLDPASP